jgi:hypothetical protein
MKTFFWQWIETRLMTFNLLKFDLTTIFLFLNEDIITRANLARQVTFFLKKAFGKCGEYSIKCLASLQVWQVTIKSKKIVLVSSQPCQIIQIHHAYKID